MGSSGYRYAANLTYTDDEVILEIGSQREDGSTLWLSQIGPRVITIDPNPVIWHSVKHMPNVDAHCDIAEHVLIDWCQPIGFAWIDGHDWPYSHHPDSDWAGQRAEYLARGQEYSQEASQRSHLRIAELIADHARVIAFDDTWMQNGHQVVRGFTYDGHGWDGKGGTAVPYLIDHGFTVQHSGDIYAGLVVLERRVS